MKMKPCGAQVLVKLQEVEQMTESGIIMRTNTEQEREEKGQKMGIVMALGPLVHADWEGFSDNTPAGKAKAWGYEVGDLVLFNRYDGQEYELPECDGLRLINSNCILGKAE